MEAHQLGHLLDWGKIHIEHSNTINLIQPGIMKSERDRNLHYAMRCFILL